MLAVSLLIMCRQLSHVTEKACEWVKRAATSPAHWPDLAPCHCQLIGCSTAGNGGAFQGSVPEFESPLSEQRQSDSNPLLRWGLGGAAWIVWAG